MLGADKMEFKISNGKKFNLSDANSEYNNSSKKNRKIDKATYNEIEKCVIDKMTEAKGTEDEIESHNKMLAFSVLGDRNAQTQVKYKISQIIKQSKLIKKDDDIDMIVEQIYRDNYGLGAIDDLIADKSINEIWVNGFDNILIDKGGLVQKLDRRFKSDEEVIRVMNQMLQYDKKFINTQEPTIESKLIDGSRITFIIPPVGSCPYMNIRKFQAFEVNEENMLKTGTINKEILEALKIYVKGRANILIIGETGGGKTSFLKYLCDYISPKLRIGTIESNFELKLKDKYPERDIFEYEEHEELGRTLGFLFRLCLRSSPKIIILGEIRGSEEGEQYINACRRGHPGSLATIHTNLPETAIPDLIDIIVEDGKKRDPALLKYRISNAIDIIIQLHGFEETGEKKVVNISEVVPLNENGDYEINNLFKYNTKTKKFEKHNRVRNKILIDKMKFFNVSDEELLSI